MNAQDLENAVKSTAKAADEMTMREAKHFSENVEKATALLHPVLQLAVEVAGPQAAVATLSLTLATIMPSIPDREVRNAIVVMISKAAADANAADDAKAKAGKEEA